MQRTIRRGFVLNGTGLHSGRPAQLRVLPGFAGQGVWFKRVDIKAGDNLIAAAWDNVTDTRLNTTLANQAGAVVSTVEHLMAALAGCGVHNAMIEIDGPEVPVFDGSALVFVRAILEAGVIEQDEPVNVIKIQKPVRVETGDAWVELRPFAGIVIDYSIDFVDSAIGAQHLRQNFANGTFVREFCDCRTFCRQAEVDTMRANGLALGGSYDNAVVVDGDAVLTPGGFRRTDECVRHKMLDALGDLALAGSPIIGRYCGEKAGHRATNLLLRELFANPDAWEMIECTVAQWNDLPGAHIKPSDFVSA